VGQPLAGVLVVALEQAVAAPFCSSRLADAGARVIKVERAEGDFARAYDTVADGESAYFVWLNRGKESLTLDIKDARDVDLLHRILLEADVFIQNLAPGAAARAGFDSAALRERNPRLITLDISGYGEEGPYAQMKAYDLLVQCETGLASITGGPEQPGRVGVSICDIACGMYAHAAVLEALLEREQTGRGQGLAVSLFDALAEWMTVPLLHQEHSGAPPPRIGLHHPSIAPYGSYRCAGEQYVVISIQNQREWEAFCEVVLRDATLAHEPQFATNSDRYRNREALDARIDAVLSTLSRDAVIERLQAGRVAYGAVNSVADLSAHPQLRRHNVATPSGSARLVADPVRRRGATRELGPVPAVGEHSAAIRAQFGDSQRDD
jgi:crotonobetainyl-CoA:carnitine CoA-transferase CaiB-like acyl-CoA transferase